MAAFPTAVVLQLGILVTLPRDNFNQAGTCEHPGRRAKKDTPEAHFQEPEVTGNEIPQVFFRRDNTDMDSTTAPFSQV